MPISYTGFSFESEVLPIIQTVGTLQGTMGEFKTLYLSFSYGAVMPNGTIFFNQAPFIDNFIPLGVFSASQLPTSYFGFNYTGATATLTAYPMYPVGISQTAKNRDVEIIIDSDRQGFKVRLNIYLTMDLKQWMGNATFQNKRRLLHNEANNPTILNNATSSVYSTLRYLGVFCGFINTSGPLSYSDTTQWLPAQFLFVNQGVMTNPSFTLKRNGNVMTKLRTDANTSLFARINHTAIFDSRAWVINYSEADNTDVFWQRYGYLPDTFAQYGVDNLGGGLYEAEILIDGSKLSITGKYYVLVVWYDNVGNVVNSFVSPLYSVIEGAESVLDEGISTPVLALSIETENTLFNDNNQQFIRTSALHDVKFTVALDLASYDAEKLTQIGISGLVSCTAYRNAGNWIVSNADVLVVESPTQIIIEYTTKVLDAWVGTIQQFKTTFYGTEEPTEFFCTQKIQVDAYDTIDLLSIEITNVENFCDNPESLHVKVTKTVESPNYSIIAGFDDEREDVWLHTTTIPQHVSAYIQNIESSFTSNITEFDIVGTLPSDMVYLVAMAPQNFPYYFISFTFYVGGDNKREFDLAEIGYPLKNLQLKKYPTSDETKLHFFYDNVEYPFETFKTIVANNNTGIVKITTDETFEGEYNMAVFGIEFAVYAEEFIDGFSPITIPFSTLSGPASEFILMPYAFELREVSYNYIFAGLMSEGSISGTNPQLRLENTLITPAGAGITYNDGGYSPAPSETAQNWDYTQRYQANLYPANIGLTTGGTTVFPNLVSYLNTSSSLLADNSILALNKMQDYIVSQAIPIADSTIEVRYIDADKRTLHLKHLGYEQSNPKFQYPFGKQARLFDGVTNYDAANAAQIDTIKNYLLPSQAFTVIVTLKAANITTSFNPIFCIRLSNGIIFMNMRMFGVNTSFAPHYLGHKQSYSGQGSTNRVGISFEYSSNSSGLNLRNSVFMTHQASVSLRTIENGGYITLIFSKPAVPETLRTSSNITSSNAALSNVDTHFRKLHLSVNNVSGAMSGARTNQVSGNIINDSSFTTGGTPNFDIGRFFNYSGSGVHSYFGGQIQRFTIHHGVGGVIENGIQGTGLTPPYPNTFIPDWLVSKIHLSGNHDYLATYLQNEGMLNTLLLDLDYRLWNPLSATYTAPSEKILGGINFTNFGANTFTTF